MKLSRAVWIVICGLGWSSLTLGARADGPGAPLPASEAYADALERRIDRLLPVLMSSLKAVRREHDPALVRCFDRAISALNSVQRQVSYHADLRYEANAASERARHTRALVLLSGRVDELARSVETCFTDGVEVQSDTTVVEVVLERR